MTTPDEPRYARDYVELARMARHLRDKRAAEDPAFVASGRLTETQAADRLRVAAAVTTDWIAIARMQPAPAETATDLEKLDMLEQAHAALQRRTDRAHAAMVAEYGDAITALSLDELWALYEAHDPRSLRVFPYLDMESQAAAVGAMLWWQRRIGVESIRWLTDTNIWMRKMDAERDRKAAA